VKAAHFEYAVFSGCLLVAGRLNFKELVTVEVATKQATKESKKVARKRRLPFDGGNLRVAIRPARCSDE
jgi:hypothetical protein